MVTKKTEPEAAKVGGFTVHKVAETAEPDSIMIFGHPKRGKSTLAASVIDVPGFNKVLVADLERGAKAFARSYPEVDVIEIPQGNIDALDDIVEDMLEHDGYDYDAFVIDTMSTAQAWLVKKLGMGKKLGYDGWAVVGEWTMQTMWDLQYMRPLGISIYHVITKENELTKETWTLPKIQGGAKDSVASVPDMNIQLRVTESRKDGLVRVADFVPHETTVSGNRFEWLPTEPLGDADMPLIYQYIRNEDVDAPTDSPKTAAELAAAQADSEPADA